MAVDLNNSNLQVDALADDCPFAENLPATATVGRRYSIVSELERSQHGAVLEVQQLLFQTQGSFRLLQKRTRGKFVSKEDFRALARSASRLRHSAVIPICDFGQDSNGPFLVTELVLGRSLRQVLNSRAKLPVKEAISIFEQLCSAVVAAHKAGIAHGNLRPETIVFPGTGSNKRSLKKQKLKIYDFGIGQLFPSLDSSLENAVALNPSSLNSGDEPLPDLLKYGGWPVADLRYLTPDSSPNQSMDSQRSDLFGLGVILFEMLTGRLPLVCSSEGIDSANKNGFAPKFLRNLLLGKIKGSSRILHEQCPEILAYPGLERLILRLLKREFRLDQFGANSIVLALEKATASSKTIQVDTGSTNFSFFQNSGLKQFLLNNQQGLALGVLSLFLFLAFFRSGQEEMVVNLSDQQSISSQRKTLDPKTKSEPLDLSKPVPTTELVSKRKEEKLVRAEKLFAREVSHSAIEEAALAIVSGLREDAPYRAEPQTGFAANFEEQDSFLPKEAVLKEDSRLSNLLEKKKVNPVAQSNQGQRLEWVDVSGDKVFSRRKKSKAIPTRSRPKERARFNKQDFSPQKSALAATLPNSFKDLSRTERLIKLLETEDRQIRIAASRELQQLGLKAAPELLEALATGKEQTRYWSAVILGRARFPASVPTLARALEDKSPEVAAEAEKALSQIANYQAAEILRKRFPKRYKDFSPR